MNKKILNFENYLLNSIENLNLYEFRDLHLILSFIYLIFMRMGNIFKYQIDYLNKYI